MYCSGPAALLAPSKSHSTKTAVFRDDVTLLNIISIDSGQPDVAVMAGVGNAFTYAKRAGLDEVAAPLLGTGSLDSLSVAESVESMLSGMEGVEDSTTNLTIHVLSRPYFEQAEAALTQRLGQPIPPQPSARRPEQPHPGSRRMGVDPSSPDSSGPT